VLNILLLLAAGAVELCAAAGVGLEVFYPDL
jgi:hypothetical protein